MSRGNLSALRATHDHEVRRGGFKVRLHGCSLAVGLGLATACASGRDKDGATSITTLAGNDEGDGDGMPDGGDGSDPSATDSSGGGSDPSGAGSITDSSDPSTTSGGDDGMGATTGKSSGSMTDATTGAPPPPMPNENCLESCSFEEFCGISTFAQCAPWCDPVDNGGPCDQALDQLYQCLIVLPDCDSLWAYYEEPGPVYPCYMQDAAAAAACG